MPRKTIHVTRHQLEALANFRYRLRLFMRHSEQITREHGLTPLQYQLMLQVRGYPGRDWATVSELAERLQAKHHGVVSLITRSEKAGLVARRRHEQDGRTVQVVLTAKGEEVLMKLAALHLRAHRGQYVVPNLGRDRG